MSKSLLSRSAPVLATPDQFYDDDSGNNHSSLNSSNELHNKFEKYLEELDSAAPGKERFDQLVRLKRQMSSEDAKEFNSFLNKSRKEKIVEKSSWDSLKRPTDERHRPTTVYGTFFKYS
jgi:hypothetical protein